MLAKLVTYNSQNYANTLGSGLLHSYIYWVHAWTIILTLCYCILILHTQQKIADIKQG